MISINNSSVLVSSDDANHDCFVNFLRTCSRQPFRETHGLLADFQALGGNSTAAIIADIRWAQSLRFLVLNISFRHI